MGSEVESCLLVATTQGLTEVTNLNHHHHHFIITIMVTDLLQASRDEMRGTAIVSLLRLWTVDTDSVCDN